MGLDQYAFWSKPDYKTDEHGRPVFADDELTKISYWRKHPNLEGFMARKWKEAGNEEEFNCQMLEITEGIVNELEDCIGLKELPETEGFFFGSNADDYYEATDWQFVHAARALIQAGQKVWYTSWW